jgi:hypothetical protein
MRADELWVESYQGEVLGEALFGLLAERETDAERRRNLEALTLLERATKDLAEPVFEWRSLDRGDTVATVAQAETMVDSSPFVWDDFVRVLLPVTTDFLAKYRELVELSTDDRERAIAEVYVAHEEALAAWARRSLGEEPGEPLELIMALPHVVALRESA